MADIVEQLVFWENKSLFSDHYLEERLKDHKEWKQDIQKVFKETTKLYENVKDRLPKYNEAQTEEHFIKPMLTEILGFSFDVQHSVKQKGRINRPDYTLFPNEESLKTAQEQREDESRFLANAIAIADAKYWERSLDGRGSPDRDPELSNANPSFQIVNYLTATGKEWGILTNGRHWRLYYAKARSRVDSYFEIDLKEILENENVEAFRYFYHFFRASAFRTDPDTGKSFLEAVYEGSIDYGVRLEKKLKNLIFEDIFLKLARGFVEYRREELDIEEETEESLAEIYQGTLRLLYRLLFLLHAESRKLLPVDDEKGYYQRSLQKLKRDFADALDNEITLSEVSDDVWNDLAALFRIIDRGDRRLNVPRYNGGLFRNDHPANEFLNEHKIADYYLVPALELLTRETDPETGQKRFIDYKSLNVEQLGSIYEGLLEFHLRIADQKLAVVKEKGREVYKPEKEVKNPSVLLEKGELYLENDKGERKATGSYYTPHYIVEYIVEQTLGPVFEERTASFRKLMEQWVPKYEEYQELDRKIKEGDKSTRSHNRRKELNLEIESLGNKATEALLSLKICDPAMGSGHFLKEATDKLAEKIITLLAEYPENPVTKLLEDIRTQILESLEQQDIAIDAEEHLKDTNLVKRMVMKRCIYGVDLNPMAVELAKLSLWLDSFTVGAPLSFLDHHLKTGNSLIGTTVKEVKQTLELDKEGQIEAFGGPFTALLTATQLMRDVASKTDATFSEVEESIDKYNEYERAAKPFKRLLDIWLSRHFSNDKAISLIRQHPERVIKEVRGEKSDLAEMYLPVLKEAEKLGEKIYFFHWELEFPEVFVDLKHAKWLDNPGFDVVVGNPPYVRVQRIEEKERDYLFKFYETCSKKVDISLSFLELGYNKINVKGKVGFISTSQWLSTDYGEKARIFFAGQKISKILDFDSLPVFKGISTYPAIFIIDKENKTHLEFAKIETIEELNIDSITSKNFAKKKYHFLTEDPWILNRTDYRVLINRNSTVPLSSFGHFYIGALTGDDETFVVSEEKVIQFAFEKELLYSYAYRGDEIDRFSNVSPKAKAIYPYESGENGNAKLIDEEKLKNNFPNIYKYLQSRKEVLVQRKDSRRLYAQGENWYCYLRPGSFNYIEPAKLIIQGVATESTVGLLDKNTIFNGANCPGYIHNNDEVSEQYILALLNSKLISEYLKQVCPSKLQGYTRFNANNLNEVPIPKIEFSQFKPSKNEHLPNKLDDLYAEFVFYDSGQNDLIELVERLFNDKKEYRLPVIHDFLAFLAEQMLEYHKEKQKLEFALDPFKFLNKGVDFTSFREVFSEAIKYGDRFTDGLDIGTVHHDIEGLRLEPEEGCWQLSLHLKHRDPEREWDDWEKDGDGNIVRSLQPVYRFELSDAQARYWQQAFEVLDQFEHNKSGRIFPGGKTRSTHEKLMETDVPVYDEKANIKPLIELREELAEVKEKIEKTDWLIDHVVYRLYGLSEEEIEVVEDSV